MWRNTIRVALVAGLFASILPAYSVQAEVLWSNPWTYSAPMLRGPFSNFSLNFTADGGVILGAIAETGFDRKAVRIGPDGSLQWAASLFGYRGGFDQGVGASIELDDGGAIVSLGSDWPYLSGEVARLDSSGNLLWSRSAMVHSIARLGTDRLVYAGCNTLTVANIQTGDVLWQRAYDRDRNCVGDGDSVIDSGSVYASFGTSTGLSVTGYRVVKSDANGNVAWNVAIPFAGGGNVVAAGNGVVYAQTVSELRALNQSDGSARWSIPVSQNAKIVLTADPAKDPILLSSSSVRRISSGSGSELWNVASSTCTYCSGASVNGDSITFLINSALGLTKLDTGTGATLWSVTLPAANAEGHSLTWTGIGGLVSNRLLGVATAYSKGASVAHFQGIDFNNGAMMATIGSAAIQHGLDVSSVVEGNDVFDAGYAYSTNEKELRLRRLDAPTGAKIWESSVPALPAQALNIYPRFVQGPPVSVSNDAIAIGYAASSNDYNGPGLTYVTLFDRATGNLRWSKLLSDEGQALTYASEPRFDDAGNVLIAVGTNLPCDFGNLCGRQFIYKLSAQSGDVLWRFDQSVPPARTVQGAGQVIPQTFDIFGSDIIVAGTFSGTTHTLLRLSGADASLSWSSDLFSDGTAGVDFYRQDDQHIIASRWPQSARVDASNGNVLWMATSTYPACTQSCNGYDQLVLPDGRLIAVGEGDSKPQVALAYNDGTGQIDRWQLEPNDPSLRSLVSFVRTTPSGKVMLQGSRSFRVSPGRLTFLMEFDPDSGVVQSQQILYPGATAATSDVLSPLVTKFKADHLMLFKGIRVSETQPYTTGAGLLDTTIVEHGNLDLSITTDRHHVSAGEALGFQLQANYSGDQPISGAHLFAGTPLQGQLMNLTCGVQAASNCAIDGRSGSIDATFDIQPGGSVIISGELTVVEQSESYYLSGTVSGPVSLSETNTIDNFSRTNIVQGLFADGFESTTP